MIASEKSNQNLSVYNHFLLKKRFKVNKKQIFLVKKLEIQVIVYMIMLTRSQESISNPMRYKGI